MTNIHFNKNFREMASFLMDDGWRTPDTYRSDNFRPFIKGSAVYLFLLSKADFCQPHKCIVAYVGMSTDLCRRLSGHEILREIDIPGYWVGRWFKPTKAEKLRSRERYYISAFDPPWNIIGRKRGVTLNG